MNNQKELVECRDRQIAVKVTLQGGRTLAGWLVAGREFAIAVGERQHRGFTLEPAGFVLGEVIHVERI